jgi:hypothetical protein
VSQWHASRAADDVGEDADAAYRVGKLFESRTRRVSSEDLRHFSSLAVALELLRDIGVARRSHWSWRQLSWRSLSSVRVGDDVRLQAIITRCRQGEAGEAALNVYLRIVDQHGNHVQEATTSAVIAPPELALYEVERDIGSIPWGELLAVELAKSEEFATTTATFDGVFGVRAGESECHFKVYKGRILEVGRRSLLSPNFVIHGAEHHWLHLLLGLRNDVMSRAMDGQFRTAGSAFDYLRLTRAVAPRRLASSWRV